MSEHVGSSRTWILIFLSFFLASSIVYCACPSGWQEINYACFKIYNTKKKWSDASATCSKEQHGAHLIYLDKGRQLRFLHSLNDTRHSSAYFVGAKKHLGSWQWGNGASVSIPSLNLLHGKYAVLKKWDLTWDGVDENHENNFICEVNETSTSEISSVLPNSTVGVTTSSQYLLASPSPSSTSSSISSTTVMIKPYVSFSPLSSSTQDLLSAKSFALSVKLPSALPSIPSTSVNVVPSPTSTSDERNGGNGSQLLINDLVAVYIHNITKLDVTQRSSLKESVDMMQNILVAMGTSTVNSTNQTPLHASQKLEEFALRYMECNLNEKQIMIKRSNVVLRAQMVSPGTGDYLFETEDGAQQKTKFFLPKENFVENGTCVVSIYYTNLEDIMNKQVHDSRINRHKVRSKILSTSIQPKKNKLIKNANIGFKIAASDTNLERKCVFWDFAKEKGNVPGWSSDGCTLVKSTDQYVECSCNHMTHFAVLMQVNDDQLSSVHQDNLSYLTYLGLAVSIVGCIMTFITYSLFTDVKSEQSQIRMNLVFVLAVAHILFLLGSPARGHIVSCISVAALMQLFYTSALCWMFAEGIQLYMQVIKVFNTNLKMRQVYGFAWGFPLSLIVVSLSVAANGNDGLASFVNEEFCWLSTENHVIWTFIAPVLLLILGNIIVLGLVMKEMKKISRPMGTGQHANALRSSFKAFVVLAPLLGITWIMGLLCILGVGVAGLYVFTILNSTQGFFIFLFHCFRNSEIRSKLQRKIQAFDDSHLKQESSNNCRRSKTPNSIKTKASIKPNTPETTAGDTPKVPQQKITLSELDSSDEVDGHADNELKLPKSKSHAL